VCVARLIVFFFREQFSEKSDHFLLFLPFDPPFFFLPLDLDLLLDFDLGQSLVPYIFVASFRASAIDISGCAFLILLRHLDQVLRLRPPLLLDLLPPLLLDLLPFFLPLLLDLLPFFLPLDLDLLPFFLPLDLDLLPFFFPLLLDLLPLLRERLLLFRFGHLAVPNCSLAIFRISASDLSG